MPTQTLLNINPDKLFEDHNVGEIQSIQIQLQNEMEKKREDLRTMVGLVSTFSLYQFRLG